MDNLIGSIMDGVVFADREGRVMLFNAAAEALLGTTAFVALGKPVAVLPGHPELAVPLRDDHRRATGGQGEVERTIELHHDERDLVYVRAVTSRVLAIDGGFGGSMTVLADVTAEYKSDQLRNRYLSIVAHELRTPLTGIKTFATMMAKSVLGELNDRQREVAEAIREQSLRLEHQIDKLVNLGNLDANAYGKDLQVVDVGELLGAAVAPFTSAAAEASIELRIDAPPAVAVRADRHDVRRAIQALVENAVKFTRAGGRIEVSGIVEGHSVRFSVRDTGIGIDPRYHRRVFEKFFQVEDPLTRHHGGAGLGLFVAAQVLAAHGSQIEVDSELGRGAGFSFRLPKYEECEPQPAGAGALATGLRE